jgi:hypothetical protein
VIHGHILPDFRRLTDHHPHPVVDEESGTDHGGGVDLDSGQKAGYMGKEAGQEMEAASPEPMGEAMKIKGMEARVAQEHFNYAPSGWIPIEDGLNVSLKGFEQVSPQLDARPQPESQKDLRPWWFPFRQSG